MNRVVRTAAATQSRRSWPWWAGLVALLALPLAASVLLPLAPHCIGRSLLGVPCPGCGLGRSLLALTQLELGRALAFYPAIAPLLVGYLAALVLLVAAACGRPLGRAGARAGAGWATIVLVLVLGNWIVNLVHGAWS